LAVFEALGSEAVGGRDTSLRQAGHGDSANADPAHPFIDGPIAGGLPSPPRLSHTSSDRSAWSADYADFTD